VQIAEISSSLRVAIPPIAASSYRKYQKFLNSSKRTCNGAGCGDFFFPACCNSSNRHFKLSELLKVPEFAIVLAVSFGKVKARVGDRNSSR